ncbi:site-specific DNA-methyltransferase [Ancylomarina longa]|uniref:site-specific DNA-methyltransferase (adenine-specific) n=1 Tax=Ancylomarina longa TaxID=2487017 RepID=A0A434AVM4_9BACT|nr:site-specific DNA-methyltransferase [Ancylomarina longa]RUT78426.1 site-specific DNA-methyltransferase [Ancylomarina longa]
MEKLKLHSKNITSDNIDKIAALFPNCITESEVGENGATELRRSIDFDLLKQELSTTIVEGQKERYQLNWPGKNKALLNANAPIAKTLRPCREESVDFDNTENLFIEGDNLDALKLLQETYLAKVKMIYIDPPYNTGKDFVYKDNFAQSSEEYLIESRQTDEDGNRLVANAESNGRFHSDWLSMMYSRLKLARNMLKDDGVIFISIDEVEFSNLRKIGEEIFGSENYIGDIVWKNSSKNDQDYISIQHEYILCFVKNRSLTDGEWKERKEGLDEIYAAFKTFHKKNGDDWAEIHKQALAWYKKFPESNPIYGCKHYSWMDERGVYFPADISGPNVGQYVYDVIHPNTGVVVKAPSRGWSCPQEKMFDLIQENKVHFGINETSVPCLKTYLKDTEFKSLTSIVFKDGRAASKRLKQIFGENIFTNPKDEEVIFKLMNAINISDTDIVFDFFAGSGTTAHAVNLYCQRKNIQCKYIAVQIAEDLSDILKTATGLSKKVIANAIKFLTKLNRPLTISEISKERIRRAGNKIKQDNVEKEGIDKLDIGFRVLKIDSSNMQDVYYKPDETTQTTLFDTEDNIKSDRTEEDLLFQVLLDWGVDLSLKIIREEIEGQNVYFVDENALAACFVTDGKITNEICKIIAERKPLRAVFRDNGFANDDVKTNVAQIFKQLSPNTDIKVL